MSNKNKTVLVIEDEESLKLAIKLKLEKSGLEVFTARKVDDGLKILKKLKKVDAIWLDHYLLGRKNGMDFVIKVKEKESWKKIPIFLISNTATQDKIQIYLKLGIHKYYTKSNLKLESIIKEINEL